MNSKNFLVAQPESPDNNQKITNLIYEIRGNQVMLDSDLAKLYKCKNGTKEINQAVKNNPEKFPDRFSWVLDETESKDFLVKNFDQRIETRGGRYKNPRVFTEQGVAMLATILKTNIAAQVSIEIMDAFVAMRKYISSTLLEQKYINNMVLEDHDKIKLLEASFQKFEEKRKNTEIYFDGQIYDAYSKIQDIFSEAKERLIIIDAYADKTTLDIIKKLDIAVTIVASNTLTKQDVKKYNAQYNNLKVVRNNTFHDRYFILDDSKIYHCGASINKIGHKTFSITLIGDKEVCSALIEKVKSTIQ
ncbi:ORF6N domain-containing protein [Candidatus Saccharibacteria bacterium]|nr:ORF6N domain-containing protein [Candidatus Saccharibacteria bacterium]